jgi:phosphoglycerate dehydrogenase-like enzyme
MNETTRRLITVLVSDSAPLDALGPLPGMRLVRLSPEGGLSDDARAAEVLVIDDDNFSLVPLLGSFPRLQLVQSVFAGIEDFRSKIPPGASLCNTSASVHDISVSEWVMAVILASLRNLPGYFLAQRNRDWMRQPNSGRVEPTKLAAQELAGRHVLIIGYGSIGRAVETRLAAFGLEIERVARRARAGVHSQEEIPNLLPSSDIVVLVVPLTDETRHLVDATFLAALPDGALVVNAARGDVVDTEAMMEELGNGRLCAALDVTSPEPLPRDHPLWTLPNCIITPHVAGATRQWKTRAYRFVGHQLRRYQRGEPLENVRATC